MATWDEALAEAMVMAPSDCIVWHSLEINHPSFTEPVRVINCPVTDSEIREFHCLLEDDAPYNPSEVVVFRGLPFMYMLPEKDMETQGSFTIKVENVGNVLDQLLWDAALDGGNITAVYREFMNGEESTGPSLTWGHLTIKNPRLQGQTLLFEGMVMEWIGRPYGRIALPSDYPGLSR